MFPSGLAAEAVTSGFVLMPTPALLWVMLLAPLAVPLVLIAVQIVRSAANDLHGPAWPKRVSHKTVRDSAAIPTPHGAIVGIYMDRPRWGNRRKQLPMGSIDRPFGGPKMNFGLRRNP